MYVKVDVGITKKTNDNDDVNVEKKNLLDFKIYYY